MAGVGSEMTVASPGTRRRITSSFSSLGLSRLISSYKGNLAPSAFCLIDYVTRDLKQGVSPCTPVNYNSPGACLVAQKSHLA